MKLPGLRIGTIKITTTLMIWVLLGVVSLGGLVMSSLGIGTVVYYLADAINILLLLFSIKRLKKISKIKEVRLLSLLLIVYFSSIIIGCLINDVKFGYFLWGARNNFRYISFFISCISLLRIEDIYKFEGAIEKIYIINFIASVVEFLLFNYRGDYLGGIFGNLKGCNGALIIFLNVCLANFIVGYIYKKIKLFKLIILVLMYFVIAAMSETKGNYFFFVIIVFIAIVISKKNIKVLVTATVSVLAVVLGLYILSIYYPDSVKFIINFTDAQTYMNAAYFKTTTFTRNNSIAVANELFFKDDISLTLFGFGLGACDMSSYFQTPFYASYGYMNYRQMSAIMTLLQTGYIGLTCYLLFFVFIFFIGLHYSSKINNKDIECRMITASCIAIFAIVDSFYASLYIDSGYWVFFALSIPLIQLKSIWKCEMRTLSGC